MRPLIQGAFYVVLVLTAICFTSCEPTGTTDTFEAAVRSEIGRNCKGNSSCSIKLDNVTSFKWDVLYVFEYYVSRKRTEYVLEQRLSEYEEFNKRFVFLLNRRIVHVETTPGNPEHALRGEIVFEDDEHPDYARVMWGQEFVATHRESGGIKYFVLQPLK